MVTAITKLTPLYFKLVIAQFVVWAKGNPSNKCVTQLGTPITITSIDIPLVLVIDKSNTREASWVTLGGLQGISQGEEWYAPIGHNKRFQGLDGG
jgi:hypothetical protein